MRDTIVHCNSVSLVQSKLQVVKKSSNIVACKVGQKEQWSFETSPSLEFITGLEFVCFEKAWSLAGSLSASLEVNPLCLESNPFHISPTITRKCSEIPKVAGFKAFASSLDCKKTYPSMAAHLKVEMV